MGQFEQWYLEVIGIAQDKMLITLDAFDADDWLVSYQLGLSPLDAVKNRYGLSNNAQE